MCSGNGAAQITGTGTAMATNPINGVQIADASIPPAKLTVALLGLNAVAVTADTTLAPYDAAAVNMTDPSQTVLLPDPADPSASNGWVCAIGFEGGNTFTLAVENGGTINGLSSASFSSSDQAAWCWASGGKWYAVKNRLT
jgi:hypothetical protein